MGCRINTLLDRFLARRHARPVAPNPIAHLYDRPVDELKRLAEAGVGSAAYALGDLHDIGCDGRVKRNIERAMHWFRRAEALEEPHALNRLGTMHAEGWPLEKDDALARRYYERAAAGGSATGHYNLARMHEAGTGGLEPSPRRAKRFLRQAARLGCPLAMQALARGYAEGAPGYRRSALLALWWHRASARRGNVVALYNLAVDHWNGDLGHGQERGGDAAAVALWREAAEIGHAPSARMLGFARETGRGTARDPRLALAAYEAAADRGETDTKDDVVRLFAAHPWLEIGPASEAMGRGDFAEAAAAYERALPSLAGNVTEEQRLAATSHFAYCLHEIERYAEARAVNEYLLEAVVGVFGDRSHHLRTALNNLAQNCVALGDAARAADLIERRVALLQAQGEQGEIEVALGQLATLRLEQGLFQDASEHLHRRLGLAEAAGEPARVAAARACIAALHASLSPAGDGPRPRLM